MARVAVRPRAVEQMPHHPGALGSQNGRRDPARAASGLRTAWSRRPAERGSTRAQRVENRADPRHVDKSGKAAGRPVNGRASGGSVAILSLRYATASVRAGSPTGPPRSGVARPFTVSSGLLSSLECSQGGVAARGSGEADNASGAVQSPLQS